MRGFVGKKGQKSDETRNGKREKTRSELPKACKTETYGLGASLQIAGLARVSALYR